MIAMNLYHRLADPDCAHVRRWIVENGLKERIDFRNVDVSEKARNELLALVKNFEVPCLEVAGSFYLGKQAIVNFLKNAER